MLQCTRVLSELHLVGLNIVGVLLCPKVDRIRLICIMAACNPPEETWFYCRPWLGSDNTCAYYYIPSTNIEAMKLKKNPKEEIKDILKMNLSWFSQQNISLSISSCLSQLYCFLSSFHFLSHLRFSLTLLPRWLFISSLSPFCVAVVPLPFCLSSIQSPSPPLINNVRDI